MPLHPTRPELWTGDEAIQLTRKQPDILLFLVWNHGKPLSNDELIRAIWPTKQVEESNLSTQIRSLQRLIAEDPAHPRLIVTISGLEYRLSAEVTITRQPQLLAPVSPSQERSGWRGWGGHRLLILLWLVERADLARSIPNRLPVTRCPGVESDPLRPPNGEFETFTRDGHAQQKTELCVKEMEGGDSIRIATNPSEEPAIDCVDLESRKKTLVRRLDRRPFAWQIGLSISNDERMAAISLINQHIGDILMVKDWK